jgi:hypothetical protein
MASTDERTKKVARNQAMYRQVNERIDELNEAFGEMTGRFLVVCECGTSACTEQIALSREAYERTRSNPTQFIVRPGHQVIAVEDVVATEPEYLVVEKHEGTPARMAEKTDPRH